MSTDTSRPSPSRMRMLSPLRGRDFRLLWIATTVSLLGDGMYLVAIAWEVYSLSNTPTALSIVGAAWTLPTIVFLLVGGAVSDRFERRRVLVTTSIVQAAAVGLIGVLTVTGDLRLPMLLALVALYGAAEAFSIPAFVAIVPTLTSAEDFTGASALDQFIRPLASQLVGPAIGGPLVALGGAGPAFLLDAATFLAAACTLTALRHATPPPPAKTSLRAAAAGIAEAFRFIRGRPWLWAAMVGGLLGELAFVGPVQVLLPYLVKNELHADASALGTIRAAAGIGGLVAAIVLAQRGLPRRPVTVMLGAWSLEALLLTGFGLATGVWTFAAISLVSGAMVAVGAVIWGTLTMTLVPNELLGRISSFDGLVSSGLIPVSFAVSGPIAQALGARETLLLCGVLGAAPMAILLALPAVRRPDRSGERAAVPEA